MTLHEMIEQAIEAVMEWAVDQNDGRFNSSMLADAVVQVLQDQAGVPFISMNQEGFVVMTPDFDDLFKFAIWGAVTMLAVGILVGWLIWG